MKDTRDDVQQLVRTPRTGIWQLADSGALEFARWGNDWHSLQDESEAFYLRVLGSGDYRYPGADLGVLVARSRMQDDDSRLTDRALQWIAGIESHFKGTSVQPEEERPPAGALAFKTA